MIGWASSEGEAATLRRNATLWMLGLALTAEPAASASFTVIPISSASDVSEDGSTVAGIGLIAGQLVGVTWTAAGGVVGLPTPPGSFGTRAYAISADGSVVVGEDDESGMALRWSGGAVVDLGPNYATGVSGDGSVVVGVSGAQAVSWHVGGVTEILGGAGAFPSDVSSDGAHIVGQTFMSGALRAVEWTAAGMNVLMTPGQSSAARATSADGRAIVGWVAPSLQGLPQSAALWLDGVLQTLGTLPGTFEADAFDVSGGGRFVVGHSGATFAPDRRAFLWDAEHGMQDLKQLLEDVHGLDLTGLNLRDATGISRDGRVIVGNGVTSNSRSIAWIAVIPEPSTASLLLIGLLALSWRDRPRRPAELSPRDPEATLRSRHPESPATSGDNRAV